jgi:hypothetical protein
MYHVHAAEFDQKHVAGFLGSTSKQDHLMRFLCSLPCSCTYHFRARLDGLDDDIGYTEAYGDGLTQKNVEMKPSGTIYSPAMTPDINQLLIDRLQ